MSGVRPFQDLVAWQKARLLTRAVYIQTQEPEFARDWGLTSQMRRAAVSVMSNIAEGFDRRRPTEFRHYLTIAKASCAELCSQLHVACDVGYIDETLFQQLLKQAEEVSRILGGCETRYTDAASSCMHAMIRNSELGTHDSPAHV